MAGTGSYAGVGIQYVIPALLVLRARGMEPNLMAKGAPIHRAFCYDSKWIYGLLIWSVGCWVVVSYKLITIN